MKEEKKGNNRESNIFKGQIFHSFRIIRFPLPISMCVYMLAMLSHI